MIDKQKNGGPAFPFWAVEEGKTTANSASGMSLRDWFAGMALQGMLSNPFTSNYLKEYYNDSTKEGKFLVHNSYKAADAMLEQRNKEQSGS